MFCVPACLISRFESTYSSTSAFAAVAANFGSDDWNVTSTSLLPVMGATVTRLMNPLTRPDSSGASSTFGASVGSSFAGRTSLTIRCSASRSIENGVGRGRSVPLNSARSCKFSFLTTRRVSSRPLIIRYCVL